MPLPSIKARRTAKFSGVLNNPLAGEPNSCQCLLFQLNALSFCSYSLVIAKDDGQDVSVRSRTLPSGEATLPGWLVRNGIKPGVTT